MHDTSAQVCGREVGLVGKIASVVFLPSAQAQEQPRRVRAASHSGTAIFFGSIYLCFVFFLFFYKKNPPSFSVGSTVIHFFPWGEANLGSIFFLSPFVRTEKSLMRGFFFFFFFVPFFLCPFLLP